MNCFQKLVPPDQKPGTIHTDILWKSSVQKFLPPVKHQEVFTQFILWKSSVLVNTDVGITTSQPQTDQKKTELPKPQSLE